MYDSNPNVSTISDSCSMGAQKNKHPLSSIKSKVSKIIFLCIVSFVLVLLFCSCDALLSFECFLVLWLLLCSSLNHTRFVKLEKALNLSIPYPSFLMYSNSVHSFGPRHSIGQRHGAVQAPVESGVAETRYFRPWRYRQFWSATQAKEDVP